MTSAISFTDYYFNPSQLEILCPQWVYLLLCHCMSFNDEKFVATVLYFVFFSSLFFSSTSPASIRVHTLIDILWYHMSVCSIPCAHFDWQLVIPHECHSATFHVPILIDSLWYHMSVCSIPFAHFDWQLVISHDCLCNIPCTHFDWQLVIPHECLHYFMYTLWLTACDTTRSLQHSMYNINSGTSNNNNINLF